MASKQNKAIKQLKKQVKKLRARIDDISRHIEGLHGAADTIVTEKMAAELQEEFLQEVGPGSKFSQEEAETADELTEDAEEVADIKEKK